MTSCAAALELPRTPSRAAAATAEGAPPDKNAQSRRGSSSPRGAPQHGGCRVHEARIGGTAQLGSCVQCVRRLIPSIIPLLNNLVMTTCGFMDTKRVLLTTVVEMCTWYWYVFSFPSIKQRCHLFLFKNNTHLSFFL